MISSVPADHNQVRLRQTQITHGVERVTRSGRTWMTVMMPLTMSEAEIRYCCVRMLPAAAPTSSGGVMMPPTYGKHHRVSGLHM